MKLIIVRHGETQLNLEQIHQYPSTPLNKTGQMQAQALAKALKDYAINYAYASDYARTRETAKEVLKFHPQTKINYVPELRERNVGIFTGKPLGSLRETREALGILFHEFRPEEGESFIDLQQRALAFYKKIIEQHKDGTVLFVTHHGVMATLFLHLTDKTLNDYSALIIGNTAITVLEIDGNKNHTVQILNNIDHLAGLA